MTDTPNFLSEFCIAGINYRKSDVVVRGQFSLTSEACNLLLNNISEEKIPSGFVLSTCNRTEVYGISDPKELVRLLCMHTHGTAKDFIEHGYIKQGIEAVEHLFKVAAGLDSQIIGDHEIFSQLKQAIRVSKHNGCINSFTERLTNYVLQASKEIRTKTLLSAGTVSVAYASIEIIKEKIIDLQGKKLLLAGTGKFGSQVAGNIKKYLPGVHLSVCNRTDEKASLLAEENDATFVPYKNISAAADEADILIVSTSADTYTITPDFFITQKPRLILDLSIPQNVDPAVKIIIGIELMNVDEISAIPDKTILMRQAEVPKALSIIDDIISEMLAWYSMKSNRGVLQKIKLQLHEITPANPLAANTSAKIQKTVSSLAVQLRNQNNKGCQYINALSNYLHTDHEATS